MPAYLNKIWCYDENNNIVYINYLQKENL